MRQRITLAFALFVTAGLMTAGCSRSSTGPEPGDQTGYPERTTPANVIAKFEMAYEAMDADEFLDCLSQDFRFYVNPLDTQGDDALPEFWDRAVEDTIARRMFGESSWIDSIRVWLTQSGDPEEIPGEPGDPSAWRYSEEAIVKIYYPPDLYIWADCQEIFLIRPDEDDAGGNGEELWEICEWHDFDDLRARDREMPSWSRIKAHFG